MHLCLYECSICFLNCTQLNCSCIYSRIAFKCMQIELQQRFKRWTQKGIEQTANGFYWFVGDWRWEEGFLASSSNSKNSYLLFIPNLHTFHYNLTSTFLTRRIKLGRIVGWAVRPKPLKCANSLLYAGQARYPKHV